MCTPSLLYFQWELHDFGTSAALNLGLSKFRFQLKTSRGQSIRLFTVVKEAVIFLSYSFIFSL